MQNMKHEKWAGQHIRVGDFTHAMLLYLGFAIEHVKCIAVFTRNNIKVARWKHAGELCLKGIG